MNIIETKEGSLLTIFVKPKTPNFRIESDGKELNIFSTEEPEKGKVNKEIIKELSRAFGFKVEMISGFTSRQKQILIRGASKSQVEKILVSSKLAKS